MKSITISSIFILLLIPTAYSSDCKDAFQDRTFYGHVILNGEPRKDTRIVAINLKTGEKEGTFTKADYNDKVIYDAIIDLESFNIMITDQKNGSQLLLTVKEFTVEELPAEEGKIVGTDQETGKLGKKGVTTTERKADEQVTEQRNIASKKKEEGDRNIEEENPVGEAVGDIFDATGEVVHSVGNILRRTIPF